MTATERLRALLDERGVEWVCYGYENHTWWNGWHAENRPSVNGLFVKLEAVCTPEQAIAATLGNELNPDGLPTGLTISEDGELLNWRGENYVKQSTLGSDAKPCYATDYTHERCKYSVNRGWTEDTKFYVPTTTPGRGECILRECEGSFSAVNRPVWLCDCGAFMTQYTDATTYHKPRFCPNCGKAVKR